MSTLCPNGDSCLLLMFTMVLQLPQLDAVAVEKHPQPAAIASMEKTLAFQSKCVCAVCIRYVVCVCVCDSR